MSCFCHLVELLQNSIRTSCSSCLELAYLHRRITIFRRILLGDRNGNCRYFDRNNGRMQELPATRALIQRVNPCHEEFLVLIAIMFWSFGEYLVSISINIQVRLFFLTISRFRRKVIPRRHHSSRSSVPRRSPQGSFPGRSIECCCRVCKLHQTCIVTIQELHTFYREEKRLDDYAARLGEVMMLLPVFDVRPFLYNSQAFFELFHGMKMPHSVIHFR